ncbi:MAG: hypothetical protein HBSAPP04_01260 [Ignavibacteriaceae bacterium]|nr:MAG: hypothetical protein HBSAPP04_01260 [Ignavibacteriaceae bacterium]
MQLQDFIPCVHLAQRRPTIRFRHKLSDLFPNTHYYVNVAPGKAEYDFVVSYFTADVQAGTNNVPEIVHLVAGSIYLTASEKVAVLDQIINYHYSEDNEMKLISELKSERRRLYKNWNREHKIMKLIGLGEQILTKLLWRINL